MFITLESLRRKNIRSIFRSHVSHVTTAMRKFTLSFTPDELSYETVVLDRAHTQIRHRYTTMVRQADYAIGKATNKHKKRAHLLKFSIEEDLPVELQLQACKRLKAALVDVLSINARAHTITNIYFNLNSYSDEQAFHYFRFRKQDIARICRAMGWTSGTTK